MSDIYFQLWKRERAVLRATKYFPCRFMLAKNEVERQLEHRSVDVKFKALLETRKRAAKMERVLADREYRIAAARGQRVI